MNRARPIEAGVRSIRRSLRRLWPERAGAPVEGGTPFSEIDSPWDRTRLLEDGSAPPAVCNLCWWSGDSFVGFHHSESAVCPACGSIARDRFLFYCFILRTPPGAYRVLETSPRLGNAYRRAMAVWFDYRASDFDERAHATGLNLDLQNLDLEDESLDVLLTPHVLEHVPVTERALNEIHRVLAPGGRMYLQVPVQQGRTAPPATPEFHGDRTPVFWRFGMDLTTTLRETGFRTTLLCTDGFHSMVDGGMKTWPDPPSPEFDIASILSAATPDDLTPIADAEACRRMSFHPAYMFLTWEAVRAHPGDASHIPWART